MTETDKEKETTAALRAAAEEAIKAVAEGGQSYKVGSRSLTRANITELRKLRESLAAEQEAQEASPLLSRTFVAYFEGR